MHQFPVDGQVVIFAPSPPLLHIKFLDEMMNLYNTSFKYALMIVVLFLIGFVNSFNAMILGFKSSTWNYGAV